MTGQYTAGAEKKRVILLSIISNALLVVIKLVIGFASGLVSIIAEALHSANDLIASVIAYFGVKKSLEPPDSGHQFGHGKIEVITGTIENMLILLIAVYIMYEGISKLLHGTSPELIEAGILVMVFSGCVNFVVSRYLIKKGRKLRSIGIEVDGEHLRADVITSFGVAGALVAMKLSGIWWLDPAAAVLVGLWIFFIFIGLMKKLVSQVIDSALPPEDIKKIEDVLKDYGEIKRHHKIRTRHSGSTIFIDMHIQVDPELSVKDSHEITKKIESRLSDIFGDANVLVHVEPCYKK